MTYDIILSFMTVFWHRLRVVYLNWYDVLVFCASRLGLPHLILLLTGVLLAQEGVPLRTSIIRFCGRFQELGDLQVVSFSRINWDLFEPS